jgi:hypothetical protein
MKGMVRSGERESAEGLRARPALCPGCSARASRLVKGGSRRGFPARGDGPFARARSVAWEGRQK